jgi:hypothetical protein
MTGRRRRHPATPALLLPAPHLPPLKEEEEEEEVGPWCKTRMDRLDRTRSSITTNRLS